MYKRILTAALACLLVNLFCCGASVADSRSRDAQAAKIKAAVYQTGTGPGAVVKVTLRDGTKLKGYVGDADGEGFALVNWETGATTRLAYAQVKGLKRLSGGHHFPVASLGYAFFFTYIVANVIAYIHNPTP